MAELVFSRLPVPEGTSISGTFGQTEGFPRPHRGLDYECPPGTPIIAPAAGVVVDFLNDGSFGIGVCLDHLDTPFFSLYAHLSEAFVGIGASVEAGDVLGLSGATGLVTGPHLHWQVCRQSTFPRDINQSADPLSFVQVARAGRQREDRAARAGASVTVANTGGCLNIRESPSVLASVFGCFPDGTVLRTRGVTEEAEGRTWVGVISPGGADGWAAGEFLV